MKSEFQKARDEASKKIDGYELNGFRKGANWAFEWCQLKLDAACLHIGKANAECGKLILENADLKAKLAKAVEHIKLMDEVFQELICWDYPADAKGLPDEQAKWAMRIALKSHRASAKILAEIQGDSDDV